MTIVEFINARLDEDEYVANQAIKYNNGKTARWEYIDGEEVVAPDASDGSDYWYITMDREGIVPSVDKDVGPHIARHDPARVLRQVKALRETVTAMQALIDAAFGSMDNYEYVVRNLVPIASIWSDHPDFDPAWRS